MGQKVGGLKLQTKAGLYQGRATATDRGRDGPKATPPSEPDWRVSRIRLSS